MADPTGGSIRTQGDWIYHTFTSSGTFTFDKALHMGQVFLVGGGKPGGDGTISGSGAGGDAGATKVANISGLSPGSYAVKIGASNAASSFANQTASGGSGASGGNGSTTSNGGNGADGVRAFGDSTQRFYGGGGGGGPVKAGSPGSGGRGGGGDGNVRITAYTPGPGDPAEPSTGSGGGGGGSVRTSSRGRGGSGSSGIVIIRYQEDPVQEVAPETVTASFKVGGPVSVEFGLRPVPLTVTGHVGVADVLAPRILTAEPVSVTPVVGGTVTSGTGPGPEETQADTLTITGSVNVALLSVTVAPTPPPPPWRRLIVSQEYADALASREPVTDARVEIIDKDDAVIATLGGTDATHPGVVAGSVTCTGDDPIRWTCDLTIDNPDLLPTAVGDLLHPLSHNRVRIWWMTQLDDKSWGEVPVGTYYLDWPSVTDDGEAAVGMSAQGSDAVAELKRNTWDTLLDVAGMEASEAIRRIIEDRAPWAQTAITPSDHRLPDEWEAGEPGGDPVDDIEAIANAAGMIFHADRMGVLTLTERPTMLGATAARFMEGPGAAITSISADIDLDEVLNRVTVASSGRLEDDAGEELPPIVAVAEDDDSTSPLWVGLNHIYHRRVESDQIATQAQAERMARDLLDGARSLVDQVELVVFAHPHLDPGEVIEVNAERAGVSGHRQIDDWSLALGDLSGQRITSSGRRGLT